MPTKAKLGYNLYILRFCSFVSFISFKFKSDGSLRVDRNVCSIIIHRMWSYVTLVYTVYMFFRLYQALELDVSEWIHTLATHLFLSLTGLVGTYWNFEFNIWSPHALAVIFNDISQTLLSGGGRKSGGDRALRILLRSAPVLWIVFPTTILSVYSEDPEAPHTVYSALPEDMKTSEVLLVCALSEYFLQCFLMTQFYFGGLTMLTFFIMVLKEYDDGMRELQSTGRALGTSAIQLHLERCRTLQLRTRLFNDLFATSIYVLKLEAMTDVITGVFFALRLYQSSPTLASASAYIAVEDLLAFNVLFSKACDIPENIENYKREIRRKALRVQDCDFGAIRRYLQSVYNVGISLGGFYCFQKTSTADFCDFVFNTTVSLLVSNPDPIVVRTSATRGRAMAGPSRTANVRGTH